MNAAIRPILVPPILVKCCPKRRKGGYTLKSIAAFFCVKGVLRGRLSYTLSCVISNEHTTHYWAWLSYFRLGGRR